MRTVGLVTLKLDSQRLPRKNLLPLGEHALCYYVVDTLLRAKNIDEVFVYCSDEAVLPYLPEGATFLKRDKKFDGDKVKAKEIYSAFIEEVDADVYVAACSTSPFTRVATVENAVDKIVHGGHDSAFTVQRHQTFCWYGGKPLNYALEDVPRTQDIEPVFTETSAFFAFKKEIWTQHGRRIGFNPYMAEVGAVEAVDIDTKEDFEFAQLLLGAQERKDN